MSVFVTEEKAVVTVTGDTTAIITTVPSVQIVEVGTAGPQGATGAVGPVGPAGPQGPQGPTGPIAEAPYKQGANVTITDADFSSPPSDGAKGSTFNTTTGKSHDWTRTNGTWKKVEVS